MSGLQVATKYVKENQGAPAAAAVALMRAMTVGLADTESHSFVPVMWGQQHAKLTGFDNVETLQQVFFYNNFTLSEEALSTLLSSNAKLKGGQSWRRVASGGGKVYYSTTTDPTTIHAYAHDQENRKQGAAPGISKRPYIHRRFRNPDSPDEMTGMKTILKEIPEVLLKKDSHDSITESAKKVLRGYTFTPRPNPKASSGSGDGGNENEGEQSDPVTGGSAQRPPLSPSKQPTNQKIRAAGDAITKNPKAAALLIDVRNHIKRKCPQEYNRLASDPDLSPQSKRMRALLDSAAVLETTQTMMGSKKPAHCIPDPDPQQQQQQQQ